MNLYKWLAQHKPGLSLKLKQARIDDDDEEYMHKTWHSAMVMSVAIVMIIALFTKSFLTILVWPFAFLLLFSYFSKIVDVKIARIKREIDGEILFAGRFLIIELESGVPLYTTFENLAKNYETIGPYFQEIVDKAYFGTAMEDAMNEVIAITPSSNLRQVLWQILNSFSTGSDVTHSLMSVLDQIGREQQISIKEYGRKLNPLAMFYMMAAIIVPSLGVTMMSVMASFMGLNISLPILLVMVVLLGFMQFMFLAVIKSSRPPMAA